MKAGDLIKMNFDTSDYGILLEKISHDHPSAKYGTWVVWFVNLKYSHLCFEHEMTLISEC